MAGGMAGGGLAREPTGAGASAGLGRTRWQFLGAGFMLWEVSREAQSVLLAPHHRDAGVGQPWAVEVLPWSSGVPLHTQQSLGFNCFPPFLCG